MKVLLPQVLSVLVLLAAMPLYQAHAGTLVSHYPLETITGGATTPDLSGSNNTATLQPPGSGPTLVAGVIGTGAFQFDGTDDALSTANQVAGPDVFTLALWFKTNTTAGGKFIGFGDNQTGISGNYDRHLYMINDGKVIFGCHPGGVRTVVSTASYNDNQWHHIAGTLSPAGMKLYVDGVLLVTDATTTGGQGYNGYWKIGRDNLNGWTSTPTSQAFAGTMDEIRVYNVALTDAEITTLASRAPAVSLTAAPSPSFFNQPVVFSGTVSSQLGTPTGGVELFEGQTSLGTATLNNGAYSFTISNLALGTHPLFVHYNGDNQFLAADSAVVNHTVNAPQATTTTLTAAPNGTQVFGAPVVLTATVSSATGTPAGTVTFTVDGNPTTVTLANGQATLTLSTLAVGAHAFSASYTPTIAFVASASGIVNYTVTQAASTTVLVSSQNPIALGQPVTFTATVAGVAPSTAQAAGTVVFTIDGQPQAPVTLNAGVATFTIALAAGNHPVTAAYSGSVNVAVSSSTTLTQAVVVPPLADSQIVFVAINGSKSFTLTGSDPANSLPLTFNVLTQPANGTLSGTAPNLIFTPTPGFTGTVTFTFNVNNTRVNSLPATVTLNVLPPPSFNSSITFQPNPVFAGQPVAGFSPVTGVSTTWNWGDGSPLSTGASASHTFAQTGVYTVSVTVTDSLSGLSTVETALVFVSASLEGSGTGGGATPPGTVGILVGGTGATVAQGGKGKISCNYVRRDKTTYSGQLGSLAIPTSVTQASLANVPSTLTIGTGANASVFRFDLNAKGKGKATGLPAIEFSVKKKRVSFKAQRIDLTTLTETLGGPQEFTKAKQPKTLMVPVTLQLGTQYFVAMTFQLKYQQINNGGKGSLAP